MTDIPITKVMTIVWHDEATKYIEVCRDRKLRNQIEDAIASLAFESRPNGIKALKCQRLRYSEGNTYRIRIGKHRIVYAVVDERGQVHVLRIGERDEVYQVR